MNKRGVTLIELLIALVISAILVAGVYRIFISQQRTYTVQDQVVEMQQNVRATINKMLREIRMVNYGRVVYDDTKSFPNDSYIWPVNGSNQVLTMNLTNDITVVGGFRQIKDSNENPITVTPGPGATEITLSALPYPTDEFDGAANAFLSIGGQEAYRVLNRVNKVLTLDRNPSSNSNGHYVFKIQAVRYFVDGSNVLRRDDNASFPVPNPQPLADNIESLSFQYFKADGFVTAIPNSTRTIQVTVTARTKEPDPEFKGGDGYRRRQIVSTIQLRNMGLPANP